MRLFIISKLSGKILYNIFIDIRDYIKDIKIKTYLIRFPEEEDRRYRKIAYPILVVAGVLFHGHFFVDIQYSSVSH